MQTEVIFNTILIISMVILALLILVAIIRSAIGPATSDRIISINMIGTIVMVLIAILTIYMKEDYLADVGLIYAMISFVAVVVLTKVYTGIHLSKRGIVDGQKAIDANLEAQPHLVNTEISDAEGGKEDGDN